MPAPTAVVHARVTDTGKLNIPSQLRREVGLEKGGPVVIWAENGELHIRTARSVIEELQAEAAALFGESGESVELFLADRQEQADAEKGEAER